MNIKIDDLNINYIDEGDINSDYAIILLHGWGASLDYFSKTINLLKQKYRVIALDFPGFGKSDDLKKAFNVDDYVNVVINFINRLSIKKVSLIGHSYGGRVIIKLNNRSDLKFEIVNNVLIDSAGIELKKSIKTKLKIYLFKTVKFLSNMIPTNRTLETLKNMIQSKYGSNDYKEATPILKETLVKAVKEDLTSMLKNIKKDTLLIWGDNDTATPLSHAKIMNKKIKNSGLVILKGTGHFSFIEDSYTYLKVLQSYFEI